MLQSARPPVSVAAVVGAMVVPVVVPVEPVVVPVVPVVDVPVVDVPVGSVGVAVVAVPVEPSVVMVVLSPPGQAPRVETARKVGTTRCPGRVGFTGTSVSPRGAGLLSGSRRCEACPDRRVFVRALAPGP